MRTASHQGPQGRQSQTGTVSHAGQQGYQGLLGTVNPSRNSRKQHSEPETAFRQGRMRTTSHQGPQGRQSQTGTASQTGQQGLLGRVSQQERPETVFRQGRMRTTSHPGAHRAVRVGQGQRPKQANWANRDRRGQRPNSTWRHNTILTNIHTGRTHRPGLQSYSLIHRSGSQSTQHPEPRSPRPTPPKSARAQTEAPRRTTRMNSSSPYPLLPGERRSVLHHHFWQDNLKFI